MGLLGMPPDLKLSLKKSFFFSHLIVVTKMEYLYSVACIDVDIVCSSDHCIRLELCDHVPSNGTLLLVHVEAFMSRCL